MRTVIHLATTCIAFALVHSLLASRQAKNSIEQMVGTRYRNGLYRLLYNLQSVAWVVGIFVWLQRQPDRNIYRVRAPWSWLMHMGQIFFLLGGLSSGLVIGLPEFWGITQLRALLSGERTYPEPEAQGPAEDLNGGLKIGGPFSLSRHPANFGPVLAFLLFPRMTTNRATVAIVALLYALVGSMHEEYRLLKAYGPAYRRYQRQVSFLFGRKKG